MFEEDDERIFVVLKILKSPEGEYLRIFRSQEDEEKSFCICVPSGDNRSCWDILAEVLDLYLEKWGVKEKTNQASPRDIIGFPCIY